MSVNIGALARARRVLGAGAPRPVAAAGRPPARAAWMCDQCGRLITAAAPPARCACCGCAVFGPGPSRPPPDMICDHDGHSHVWPPGRPTLYIVLGAPFLSCVVCGRVFAPDTRPPSCPCGGLIVLHSIDLPAQAVVGIAAPRTVGVYTRGLSS